MSVSSEPCGLGSNKMHLELSIASAIHSEWVVDWIWDGTLHSNRGFAGKDMDLVRPKWMLLQHIAFILIVFESSTGPGRVMEASRAPRSILSLVCPKLLGWIWNGFEGGRVFFCRMNCCERLITEESHPNLFANTLGFLLFLTTRPRPCAVYRGDGLKGTRLWKR